MTWLKRNLCIGVGPSKAKEWYDCGMRTLDDVAKSKEFGITLSPAQELGLKYYDHINERIPRAEVGRLFHKIQRAGEFSTIKFCAPVDADGAFFSSIYRPLSHCRMHGELQARTT
jgi:hypothetical protein